MAGTSSNNALQRFSKDIFRIAWFIIVFLSIALVVITAKYFSLRTDINFLLAKQDYINDLIWMSAFYIHVSGSIICLAVGPFQFVPSFRKKYMTLHRVLGKIYLGSIFVMAAPSGLYMSIFANGGIGAQLGFLLLSFLWFYCTYLAYTTILNKDIKAHRKWMVYSFALTFSAVTLRLWTPFLSYFRILNHEQTVVITAYNWILNLIVAYFLLKFSSKKL